MELANPGSVDMESASAENSPSTELAIGCTISTMKIWCPEIGMQNDIVHATLLVQRRLKHGCGKKDMSI